MSTRKTFVLDTNVLLHDPLSMFQFADNVVVVPIIVLEEIDQFKRNSRIGGARRVRSAGVSTSCASKAITSRTESLCHRVESCGWCSVPMKHRRFCATPIVRTT